jgi:hypothetical protein
MGVTYAPPGGPTSSVTYQTTNIVGNTTTNSSSFTTGFSETVSATTGLQAWLAGASVTDTQSSAWTQKSTNSNTVTITNQSSNAFKTPGVPTVYSPVNHDYDIIWLWLNPVVLFTVPNNSSNSNAIIWNGYGYDYSDPLHEIDIWPVYVGWLNGHFGQLDAQDANAFSRSWVKTQTFAPGQGPGITKADYANILQADPFANNPYDSNTGYTLTLSPGTNPLTSIDGRFTISEFNNTTPQSIPYKQAPLNSTQGEQETYQQQYSTNTQTTNNVTNTYQVGFGLEEKFSAFFIATLSADFKQNWTSSWDNTYQTTISNTNTQTDTAVITSPPCPATSYPCNPNYTEPHEFTVYQDNLYGTFLFWPNPYFSISNLLPVTNSVSAGGTANYTGSTIANAGYSGPSISFSITGLPKGATYKSNTVTAGAGFTLSVSTTPTTPTGSYPLTIQATDGTQLYYAYATLLVTAPPLKTQTINFGAAPTLVVGGSGTVSATGGASGNPVTFSSTTLGVCTVSGSSVNAVTAGTCIIAANQAGNASYNPATQVTQTLTVSKANQTLSFGTAPAIVVGSIGKLSATGGASGNPVSFASTTLGVCTVSASSVNGVAAGTCIIAANQAGNANYNPATQATQTFNVSKASQTLNFGAALSVIVGGNGSLSATGGASGNPVTLTSTTTGVCTVSGTTVYGLTAGSCTIVASQVGNANYNPATQVTQTFSISKGSQTVSFDAAPTVVVGGSGSLSANGGASGNPVTFTSTTTNVCTVSGSSVYGVASGSCTLLANQAGNANYNPATEATQTLGVGKGSQTINFGAIPNLAVGGSGTLSATGGASGNPVTFSSTSAAVCTVSGNNVKGVSAGTCSIAANQAGNANYNPATQATQSISVSKK